MLRTASSVLGLMALSLVGCADGQMICRVGADCPSGLCMSDGTCALPRDAGMPDALVLDTGTRPDAFLVMGDTGVPVDTGVRHLVFDTSMRRCLRSRSSASRGLRTKRPALLDDRCL